LANKRPANPVTRIFKGTANDSPSPRGEGRVEGAYSMEKVCREILKAPNKLFERFVKLLPYQHALLFQVRQTELCQYIVLIAKEQQSHPISIRKNKSVTPKIWSCAKQKSALNEQ
jgi:hypothetical protein